MAFRMYNFDPTFTLTNRQSPVNSNVKINTNLNLSKEGISIDTLKDFQYIASLCFYMTQDQVKLRNLLPYLCLVFPSITLPSDTSPFFTIHTIFKFFGLSWITFDQMPSPKVWGPYWWKFLDHLIKVDSQKAGEFISSIYIDFLPCAKCQSHLKTYLIEHPLPNTVGTIDKTANNVNTTNNSANEMGLLEWVDNLKNAISQVNKTALPLATNDRSTITRKIEQPVPRFSTTSTVSHENSFIDVKQFPNLPRKSEAHEFLSSMRPPSLIRGSSLPRIKDKRYFAPGCSGCGANIPAGI